jgi:hypothetical protein
MVTISKAHMFYPEDKDRTSPLNFRICLRNCMASCQRITVSAVTADT